MAKRLVDDTLVTTDEGGNRMYYELTPTLRLRSCDSYNVVLECYKDIKHRETGTTYKAWVFEGYFPSYNFLFGGLDPYYRLNNARWKKAWDEQELMGSMRKRAARIGEAFPAVKANRAAIETFIKEAKIYEGTKASEKGLKAAKARKNQNA